LYRVCDLCFCAGCISFLERFRVGLFDFVLGFYEAQFVKAQRQKKVA